MPMIVTNFKHSVTSEHVTCLNWIHILTHLKLSKLWGEITQGLGLIVSPKSTKNNGNVKQAPESAHRPKKSGSNQLQADWVSAILRLQTIYKYPATCLKWLQSTVEALFKDYLFGASML